MVAASLALAALVVALLLALSFYAAHRNVTGNGRVPLTVRPERFGLSYEPVSCRTSDGLTLKGWFVPASAPSDRTLLFCHGWGTNKGEILKFTHALAGQGFNLLYFDFRACGESEGEMLSVGYLENRDFDAAVGFLKSHRPHDRYGVFGLSMGAMVSFCGVARHPGFTAAVLESPFKSHDSSVERYMRVNYGVPYFPLIPMMLFWLRVRLGGNPELISPVSTAHQVAVPVLAIFGTEDRMVPPEEFSVPLERVKSSKEVWVIQGAGHARCAETAGPAYTDRLAKFYRTHMPASGAAAA
jgi:pimeloyl-ACP methyl ester carboxylesterase